MESISFQFTEKDVLWDYVKDFLKLLEDFLLGLRETVDEFSKAECRIGLHSSQCAWKAYFYP